MVERRFEGRGASPGLARGPLAVLHNPEARAAAGADGGDEAGRLRAAIERASVELEALAEGDEGDAAEVLSFQVEMLRDPALSEGAFRSIQGGRVADEAWTAELTRHAAGYEDAGDDYLAARAADLRDLGERVLGHLRGEAGALPKVPERAVVVAEDLSPSRFLELSRFDPAGVALRAGSALGHVAILARARGLPLAIGLRAVDPAALQDGVPAWLDGDEGVLILDAEARTEAALRARLEGEAAALGALDGPSYAPDGSGVEVMVNVDDPASVGDAALAACDGVGLLRTEFLFAGRPDLPSEDEQHEALIALLKRLGGKPLVARTLDVGGDKPLPALSLPREANPFLGLRGLRLCLERPGVFEPQLRAMLRAADKGDLRIMLPMVTAPGEVEEARALVSKCAADLERAGVPHRVPPLGIMVETPAAALTLDLFDVEFASIGSNDLTQYLTAAARDATDARVAASCDSDHPAVDRAIEAAVRLAGEKGIELSLCGDLAASAKGAERLVNLGLRKLSVAPAALGRVRAALRGPG